MSWKKAYELIRETVFEWSNDKCPKLSAALSYYTVFSLAPLLVIVISIAGLLFDKSAAQGLVVYQIGDLIGDEGARAVEDIILNASKPTASTVATIIGFITLLVGATGVFVELDDSLDTIWKVPRNEEGKFWLQLIRERILSFSIVLGIGFLLIVSLVASAAVSAIQKYFKDILEGYVFIWNSISFLFSISVLTLLFAILFKLLPNVKVFWRDVWLGGFITSLLFSVGKSLIGLYLGRGAVGSVYGAAGSLALILLWVYYSAQIFFLGAEFTYVLARSRGSLPTSPEVASK